MEKTALLLIDLQVGALENAHDAGGVVERTAALVDRARREEVPVIWVQHSADDLPRGSARWEFAERLSPAEGETVVHKRWGDAFQQTGLSALLEESGIRLLVLPGAQSDACIRHTWHSALQRGYSTVLVEDCHTTEDGGFDGIALPAEQIIAFTNRCACFGCVNPDVSGISAPHDTPPARYRRAAVARS